MLQCSKIFNVKKRVAKKATAKKPAPKAKATTKAKTKTAKQPKPLKKPAAKKTTLQKTSASKSVAKKPATRRPDPNLPLSVGMINGITDNILTLMTTLDNYAANLSALDRQRHNGVGLKRLGFIEAALRISTKFPQYFPHWLDTEKFKNDLDLFNAIRSLVEVCRSLEEKAWNINVESSDMIYTVNIVVKRIQVWQSKAGFCGYFLGFIGMQIVMALHNV